MEESFEKKDGVLEVISGYSGGTTKNPTYKEVTYGNTGHFETIAIIFDKDKTNYEDLLNHFWKNIDPFDAIGQFCDKGYSYRSVVFYQSNKQKEIIEKSMKAIELKFNKKIVTYIRNFDKFYEAESYHQDYYKKILLIT
jgi:methionine-S-sulfoxide reductase